MSSRISCWLRGHQWAPPGSKVWSDLFGNLWRIQRCRQCGATRRVLHRRWDDRGRYA